jgi:hypothetical protein
MDILIQHKKKLERLEELTKKLDDKRLLKAYALSPAIQLLKMMNMLIPIQVLIIMNSDGMGRIGRLLSGYDINKDYLIYGLLVVLVITMILSILFSYYSIKIESAIAKQASKRKLGVSEAMVKRVVKAKGEVYLLITIILVIMLLSPILSALASLLLLMHMYAVEDFYKKTPNAMDMLLKTTPVLIFIVIFIVLLLVMFFGDLSLGYAIVMFFLLRIFSNSVPKLERTLLKI